MEFEMPRPGPEHAQLARMAGEWSGEETISPSPFDPEEQKRHGTLHTRVLEDFFVVADYEQRDAEGQVTFRGHGVYSWNSAESVYTMYWFDSMGGPGGIAKGRIEDDVLTFESDSPMGRMRYRYTFSGERRKTFEMAMSPDGSNWHRLLFGDYSK